MERSVMHDTPMAEKALEFDRVAEEVFAPIYPVIASRLLELAGVHRGRCLDIGCGGGHLGLAVAKGFEGTVILLDVNPYAVAIADQRIPEEARGCIHALWGDVHALPLTDASMDLVLSRGAMWFWKKEASLKEIWRILAPGGAAILGGGYGTAQLKTAIYQNMSVRNQEDFGEQQEKRTQGATPEDYAQVMERLDMGVPRCIHEESGDWLLFRKPSEGTKEP
ncbi:MAG: class I SAM-dependent methyltransferase [Treponema sp.]|jgi:ubiquinone/menaquinone biosynthesis C-methylase UbiE|nr:class I SAM-dependent methyltransferase [Treponema sp.]